MTVDDASTEFRQRSMADPLVPAGRLKIARRFIAGLFGKNSARPSGTVELAANDFWPKRPSGTRPFSALYPGDKSPGYFQTSLWDVSPTDTYDRHQRAYRVPATVIDRRYRPAAPITATIF